MLLVSGIVGVQQILNQFFTVALGFDGSGLDANLGAKSSSTDCCSCNFLLVLVWPWKLDPASNESDMDDVPR